MPNAIDLIREDHEAIREKFRSFAGATTESERKSAVQELLVELQTHASIEEDIFYPWTRTQGLGDSVVDISEEEHHAARTLILELSRLEPSNPRLTAKLMVLKEAVDMHMAREEEQVLGFSRHFDAEALERIGEKMAQRRSEARADAEDLVQGGVLSSIKGIVEQLREARAG